MVNWLVWKLIKPACDLGKVIYRANFSCNFIDHLTYLTMALWCCGTITDCCFSDQRSIPTSASWEFTMVALLDDSSFCKYRCHVFVGFPLYKSNSSSPSSPSTSLLFHSFTGFLAFLGSIKIKKLAWNGVKTFIKFNSKFIHAVVTLQFVV